MCLQIFWFYLTVSSIVQAKCEDKKTNCASYGSYACSGVYKSWARQNCERFCGFCTVTVPTTPSTVATTSSTIATTTTRKCEDKKTNCASYGSYACSGVYKSWARQYCERFCGFCTVTVPTTPSTVATTSSTIATTTTPKCKDKETNCANYGSSACTGDYEPWARQNCEKFCGFCTVTGTTTVRAKCEDKRDDCKRYSSSACTGAYESWARDNCQKFCGFCTITGSTTTTIATTPTTSSTTATTTMATTTTTRSTTTTIATTPTTSSTTTTTTMATTTTTPAKCEDKNTNCANYGSSACTGDYEPWARQNCEKFCGFCTVTGPTTVQAKCEDKKDDCKMYSSSACTGAYESWARDNCRKFCGFCTFTGSTTTTTTTTTIATTPTTMAAKTLPQRRPGTCEDKYKHHFSGQHSACLSRSPKHTSITGVRDEDKKLIVYMHNKIRSEVSEASYMMKMRWDDEIAMVAQRWAEACLFVHDSNRDIPGRFHVSQNIAEFSKQETDWPAMIKLWASEKQYYVYDSGRPAKTGHYTMMVQDNVYQIGCGESLCGDMGHFYVCNYGPGFRSGNPYTLGKLGERCPATVDKDKLCDCKGQICYSGGDLDPNTCQCKCASDYGSLNLKPENRCKLFCKSAKDPNHCSWPGFVNTCAQYSNIPSQCPFMCKVCPWGGEDYNKGSSDVGGLEFEAAKMDNAAHFFTPSLAMTTFAFGATVSLRILLSL